MPATAGRVRMPANNRVHSSAALQTHGIWQSAIGYDPYAPEKDSKDKSSGGKPEADGRAENAYASFQGLLALARITGSSANDTRGACKKCGRIGHLTYQCRNFLSVKEDKEKDEAALQNATVVFDKIKKASGMKEEKESSEEDSESSDSDADSEIERIIAARSGKNRKKVDKDDGSKEKKREKRGRLKKRSGKRARRCYDDDDDGDKEDDAKRKEKRHRRRYASSEEDSSEEERGRKVKKLRKRHAGSDDDGSDEDNRHRHHRKSRKERKRRSHH